MKTAPALLVLVLLGATAAIAADTTITPGQGIGPVTLSENLSDVIKVLGKPKVTQPWGDYERYNWFEYIQTNTTTSAGGGGLFVDCTPDGTVVKVSVFYAPQYRLENGLHTRSRDADDGSHEQDILRLMGAPRETITRPSLRGLAYRGVTFWVNASHQIPQIDVVKNQP